jgi:glycosyltransferase involved in cell wall biosynthesis
VSLTQPEFSLVIPVFKNEANVVELIDAINVSILADMDAVSEVIFVIDGSPDHSLDLLRAILPTQTWPSQLISHSRNFGSLAAIRTGIAAAKGKAIAVMAADLQEPPNLVREFWEILSRGEADVVFGRRIARHDGWASNLAASVFWGIYRKLVFPEIPDGGLDVFAVNTRVRDVVLSISEPNSSLIAQLLWVGFRRQFVPYVRQPRGVGRSAHTFRRKLTYMIDSFISFTDLPIMFQIWLGLVGLTVSGIAGLVTLGAWLGGWVKVQGYTPLMLMLAFASSFLLLSQGVLGLYLWRTFENTKRRPLSIISEHINFEGAGRDKCA